jgi:hypothetical protein
MAIEMSLLILLTWIAIYDIKYHLIRNIDLLILSALLIPYYKNWSIGMCNLFFYLLMNLIFRKKIGSGDIKLSLLIALPLDSLSGLLNAISFTWILGGSYSLIHRSHTIAFAPFMIYGTYLARLL